MDADKMDPSVAAAAALASASSDDDDDEDSVEIPLSQLHPNLDDVLVSAMQGESDRKFLNSMSQRKKRRDRRRPLSSNVFNGGDVDAGDGQRSSAVAVAAAAAAAPLLTDSASPNVLEEGGEPEGIASENLENLAPPTEFGEAPPDVEGGVPEEELLEEVEIVREQIDALPAMVAPMEGRRAERQNLQYRMRTIAAKVPPAARARQAIRRMWLWLSDIFAHAFDGLTLGIYRTSFGRIEGNFGSGCASFFSFIRWLFIFNLVVSCIIFASSVFPYMIIAGGREFYSTMPAGILNGSVAVADPTAVGFREAVRCTRKFQNKVANSSRHDTLSHIASVITGGGWMLKSNVFLGSYFHLSTPVNASTLELKSKYNTPLAMLLCLVTVLACGIGAALSTSNSLYRQILKVSVRGTKSAKFSSELFTAWDFGLRAQKAARLRHRTVAMRLRSMVLHLQLKARSRSSGTLVARVLANVATTGLYCAAAYLIYYTTELQSRLMGQSKISRPPFVRLLIDLMPQLIISVVNIIIPMVLSKLIIFEYYSASVEILIQLGRVVFLKLLSFVTLIATIGVVLLGCSKGKDCGNCVTLELPCWETYVGQQLYRTLVIDVLLCLLVTPALNTLRWLLKVKVGGRVFSKVPLSELLISNEVLGLVYRQSICFLGVFFCPWVLPIACLSYGCLFHIKRFTLRFMAVSNKSFRASRLERFFLDVLLLFLFVLLVPLTICVLRMEPSRGCGPYRVYQSNTSFHIANTLTEWVDESDFTGSDIIRVVFQYTVLNPTAHLLVLLLLIVFTYFFYSVIKARDTLIDFLERKLQSESKVKLELANRELQLMRMAN